MVLINARNHSQGCIVQSRRKLAGNGKNSAAHLISSTQLPTGKSAPKIQVISSLFKDKKAANLGGTLNYRGLFKPWCQLPLHSLLPLSISFPRNNHSSPRAEHTRHFSPQVTALTYCPAIVHHHQISIRDSSLLWVHRTGHEGNQTSKKISGQVEVLHPFLCLFSRCSQTASIPTRGTHTELVAFSGPFLCICKK